MIFDELFVFQICNPKFCYIFLNSLWGWMEMVFLCTVSTWEFVTVVWSGVGNLLAICSGLLAVPPSLSVQVVEFDGWSVIRSIQGTGTADGAVRRQLSCSDACPLVIVDATVTLSFYLWDCVKKLVMDS